MKLDRVIETSLYVDDLDRAAKFYERVLRLPALTSDKRFRAYDVGGQSVLLLDDGHCFRDQALAFCTKAKAAELEFRATSLATLVKLVAGGDGVTVLPILAVASVTKRARVAFRRFS